jgi:hypothetical protein
LVRLDIVNVVGICQISVFVALAALKMENESDKPGLRKNPFLGSCSKVSFLKSRHMFVYKVSIKDTRI